MKVDFNNVRLQALHAYDKLVERLNNSQSYEGHMLVDPNMIEEPLNDLRMMIGTIAMSYDPDGDEELKNVYPPEPYTMKSFTFNSEEDE